MAAAINSSNAMHNCFVRRRLATRCPCIAAKSSRAATRVSCATQVAESGGHEVVPEEAWKLLTNYTKQEFKGTPNSTYGWQGPPVAEVLIGIVAGDVRLATRALRDWCQHLNLEYHIPNSRVPGVSDVSQVVGGVYIKYVSTTKLCYLTQYDGHDRGVLLQLGQRQFGHFPLGLFDETMQLPAPDL